MVRPGMIAKWSVIQFSKEEWEIDRPQNVMLVWQDHIIRLVAVVVVVVVVVVVGSRSGAP